MEWIKASERLPDNAKDYGSLFWIPENTIVRRIDTKAPMDSSYFGSYGKKWGLENYEWLSEPPSAPVEQEGQEEMWHELEEDMQVSVNLLKTLNYWKTKYIITKRI